MREEIERQGQQDKIDLAREERFRERQTLIHDHFARGGSTSIREEYRKIRESEDDLREEELVLSNSQPGGGPQVPRRPSWDRQTSRLQRRLWFIMLILVALVLSLLRFGQKMADNLDQSNKIGQPEQVAPGATGE